VTSVPENSPVIIWTEGGPKIGMGHVCRSLVVARELKKQGANVLFFINGDPSVVARIKDEGFKYAVTALNKAGLRSIAERTPQSILIDTKKPIQNLIKQIRQVRSTRPKIVLMDNTTPARLEADIVIYPTAIFEDKMNWDGFKGKVFGGAEYIPVAESYVKARHQAESFQLRPAYQILVTMGGSDPNRLTYIVVSSLLQLTDPIRIKVIIGPSFLSDDWLSEIERHNLPNVEFVRNQNDLAGIMAESHVAITTLGTTLHELAGVGVPAIIISNYETDSPDMASYTKAGFNLPLGHHETLQPEMIQNAVKNLLLAPNQWQDMRNKGWEMIDGKGAVRLVSLLNRAGSGKLRAT
jgi:UDP-2,4-diacetamido-2,4,6-trideoxy-beta-L-altropyranose hydrolase